MQKTTSQHFYFNEVRSFTPSALSTVNPSPYFTPIILPKAIALPLICSINSIVDIGVGWLITFWIKKL